MTLLRQSQHAFLACILDDELPAPAAWSERQLRGLAIYRAGYRARLIEAMRETFARTARLVGDDAFGQAAAHHLITHPPTGWTLDRVGQGFDQTCAELFVNDADVAEVAWLEWAMHCCFTAADSAAMTADGLMATSEGFDEAAWARMRFDFLPGTAIRRVRHDLVRLWSSLDETAAGSETSLLDTPVWAVVWRESERPVFVQLDDREGLLLAVMLDGATFSAACGTLAEAVGEDAATRQAGAAMGSWLSRGWIVRLRA